ncbi:hypothetical protein OKA04_06645 [Luteolibacter flavescens]|uniref:Uncharacterized protein n=1 Tax=Luteolibacter flavescens TaxID=1859460 RepID=A0ABT3FLF9_9BACT|nr:hypothetical protein [Luteolibacter flavescens]MCW1884403.1 hypothetical protein [Luteolibacter flavescens]
MDPRHFLPVPVRLKHLHPDFLDRLASLGGLCLRAKNLAVELASMTDPGGAILEDDDLSWLPSSGLSFNRSRLAGVHALRAAQLTRYPGVLELDFVGDRHPIGFAIPPDGADALAKLVADFCEEECDHEQLIQWRNALVPPFEPCNCCKSSIEMRRAHADAHPLAPILGDAVESGIELHCRVADKSYSFERFIQPAKIDLKGAITVNDMTSLVILRIDPALIHSVHVGTTVTDREVRTVVKAHDLLGNEALVLSMPGDSHVQAWRHYCAVAGA